MKCLLPILMLLCFSLSMKALANEAEPDEPAPQAKGKPSDNG